MANYISRLGAYEFYFSSFNIIKADIDKITSYQNSNTAMYHNLIFYGKVHEKEFINLARDKRELETK